MPGDHDHCRGFSLSLGKTPVKHISCRSNLHEYGRVTTAWPSAFGDAPHTRHGRPLPPIQPVKCPHVAQQGTWKASDFHIRRSFINAMAPCPSKQSLWVGRVREGVFCCQGGWVAEIELSGSGRGGGGHLSISPIRRPPARDLPSVGCRTSWVTGPMERACILSTTMCLSLSAI